MSKWIKTGDMVLISVGNDKGRTGKVLRCQGDYVYVQGINLRKKHVKKKAQKFLQQGAQQIVEQEMGIHISNVVLCNADGKKLKTKVSLKKDGGKDLVSIGKDKKESFIRTIKH